MEPIVCAASIRSARGFPPSPAKKEGKGRHNFRSAASITLMSGSPEPPERLAEILLEILAFSKPTRTSQSESTRDSDLIESFDSHSVEEQSQRTENEDKTGQQP
jgi:hypothetical protein